MKLMTAAVSAFLAVSMLGTAALAAGPAKSAAKGKTLKCPACGMAMPMKKSAATPVAVPIKGKTYYCCAGCPAGKAHMKPAKMSGKPAAAKKM